MNKVFAIAGAIALSMIPTPSFSGEVEQKIEKLCGTDRECLQMMSRRIEMRCGTDSRCLQMMLKRKEQMINERERIERLCGTDGQCRHREARKRHYEARKRHYEIRKRHYETQERARRFAAAWNACIIREAGTINCRCQEARNVCRAEVRFEIPR